MSHDLMELLKQYQQEQFACASRQHHNWQRGRILAFQNFLERAATATDVSPNSIARFEAWLTGRGLSRWTIRNRVYFLRTFWRWLFSKGFTQEQPPGRGQLLIGRLHYNNWLIDAPILPTLMPVYDDYPAYADDIEVTTTPAAYGLDASDLDAARKAEREALEDEAWSMLVECPQCGKRFVPVGRNSDSCSRGCYLKLYRKREAKRYAGYTRQWREKVS